MRALDEIVLTVRANVRLRLGARKAFAVCVSPEVRAQAIREMEACRMYLSPDAVDYPSSPIYRVEIDGALLGTAR